MMLKDLRQIVGFAASLLKLDGFVASFMVLLHYSWCCCFIHIQSLKLGWKSAVTAFATAQTAEILQCGVVTVVVISLDAQDGFPTKGEF